MTAPTDYLRDIHGLDPISWWPPAPAWVLLALAVLLAVAGAYWLFRSGFELWGWRYDARRRLRALRARLSTQSPKASAAELSELLRRIAIARCGRSSCAGLSGEDWLDWLADNDPEGFDWRNEGQSLLSLPYAPDVPADAAQAARLDMLVEAALKWVAASVKEGDQPCRVRERLFPGPERGYASDA